MRSVAKVKIKLLHPDAKVPTYALESDAAFDLCALEDKELAPGETHIFNLGIATEYDSDYVALIHRRSGLASNHGIMPVGTGVIDSGYRGEWKVAMINLSKTAYKITKGDRIVQVLIQPTLKADFELVNDLSISDRMSGHFGSTGK